MATTADFRNGMCIEFNDKLYQIVEFQHVQPGRGSAFVRTKLRSLENGKLIDNTFNSGVKITEVRIERREYQFLYNDTEGYNFMNNENFEQISIPVGLIDSPQFLKEGMNVEMLVRAENEQVLTCELPAFIEADVTYTEPGVKGNTATNASKPAKIETGAEIRVPLFVNEGDRIKVDTRTSSYVERVKK
jgi:elongation factor P